MCGRAFFRAALAMALHRPAGMRAHEGLPMLAERGGGGGEAGGREALTYEVSYLEPSSRMIILTRRSRVARHAVRRPGLHLTFTIFRV